MGFSKFICIVVGFNPNLTVLCDILSGQDTMFFSGKINR